MSNLTTVDRYGELKSQIAALTAQLDALKAEIIAIGNDAVEGHLYRIAVLRTTRAVLDQDAVRKHVSPQFLIAHTRHIPITSLRVAPLRINEVVS